MSDTMLMASKVTSDPKAKPEEGVTDKIASADSDTMQLPAICDVEEHFDVLKEALEATSRAFRDLWDRNETLQRQNNALMKERDQLLVKNESSRIELEELRRSYSTVKQYIDQRDRIEERYTQLDKALRDSIAERQRLETDRIRMGDEFQSLKDEHEALKRDYGRLPKITF